MKFNTPEEAVAFAMSIQPRPMYFRQKVSRHVGRIGKYNARVTDPFFGKWYVDIQTPFGSDNRGVPETFPSYEAAAKYLTDLSFVPVK